MILTMRKGSAMMNMYEVQAKCGHVGKHRYTIKAFAVLAENGSKAAETVRKLPRVKHDCKDAILDVMQIDTARFNEIWFDHMTDPYFSCKSIQEQRMRCDVEMFDEIPQKNCYEKRGNSGDCRFYKKRKIRDYKRYRLNYVDEERWAG